MADKINLADPDFEPTDEQLIGLSKRAFAHVAAENRAALAKVHAEIDAARRPAIERAVALLKAARKGA